MNAQAPLLVTITTADLRLLLEDVLEEKLAEFAQQPTNDEPGIPELLTRKQAAEFLNCTVGTIDNLTKRGLLTKHYLGGLPRFRRDELRAAFANWQRYQR